MAIEGNQLKLANINIALGIFFVHTKYHNQLVKLAKTVLTSRPRNERNRFRRAIKLDFAEIMDLFLPQSYLPLSIIFFVFLKQNRRFTRSAVMRCDR